MRPKIITQNESTALVLSECLAKTYLAFGNIHQGRTVLEHSLITSYVAEHLIALYPDFIKERFFPPGSNLGVGVHDVGKISPRFQKKIRRLLPDKPLELENISDDESGYKGHASVSYATLYDLNLKYIPEIAGFHHGYRYYDRYNAKSEIYGGEAWQKKRIELIQQLKNYLQCDFPVVTDKIMAKALSGLTTVSDWIGSCSLFDDPNADFKELIAISVKNAGFVKPIYKHNLSFEEIFGQTTPDFKINSCQEMLSKLCNRPGIYILEAPMGIGKTEAALYAAYQLLAADLATGIYFALPTQLTSNKIHDRVAVFLNAILHEDSKNIYPMLLHSNAYLCNTEMGEDGGVGKSWFSYSKRGILAPFAVGTIDQALMAVINVKHSFVRTFGLIGKVVILDEVHSYDTYTGTIIDELVKELSNLGATVIILSATLTKERRANLLGATGIAASDAYPLVSVNNNRAVSEHTVTGESLSHKVALTLCDNDEIALQAAVSKAKEGQQVLWIENTVDDAVRIYRYLMMLGGVICGLIHSRFTRGDRAANEDEWVGYFGKGNHGRYAVGRILVGTQVLEQSLDIDADYLITRLSPIDMFLQRLGRLHRHNIKRHDNAVCGVTLLIPHEKYQFGKSGKVYSPYVLARTEEVLRAVKKITLPDDIRNMLEEVYAERVDDEAVMIKWKHELIDERDKLKRFAQIASSTFGDVSSDDEYAKTRYAEEETVEVLLIKSYSPATKELILLDGGKVILNGSKHKNDRRNISIKLSNNCLSVYSYMAPKNVNNELLSALSGYIYVGDGERQLRLGLVKDSGEIVLLDRNKANDKYEISYFKKQGYIAKKT